MPDLVFDRVSFSFGNFPLIKDFSLTVHPGDRIVLMGASGSGKTTLLRLAAGLIRPTEGTISGIPPINRISMQFQDSRLLPWLTAAENVNLVLSDSKSTLPIAEEWLRKVSLEDSAHQYPAQLSGGMQQRVALCRALAAPHDILILDEPFRGLDEQTRDDVMHLVLDCISGNSGNGKSKSLLLVTHDVVEAAFFSDSPFILL